MPLLTALRFLAVVLLLLLSGALLRGQAVALPVGEDPVVHTLHVGPAGTATVELTGLKAGDRYEVTLVDDKRTPQFAFGAPPPYAKVSGPLLRGVAPSGRAELTVRALYPSGRPARLSVRRGVSAVGSAKLLNEVVTVEHSDDADYLLNTLFRQDTCFTVDVPPNAIQAISPRPASDGSTLSQTGIFRNGAASVGIDSGIVITTGFITAIEGPNSPNEAASGWADFLAPPQNGQDPDADALISDRDIYDLASITFRFVPTTDTITFNYVFFSEQYCENLDEEFSRDAFGFILTGPDGTSTNIATLPVSGDIVSPATLRPGFPDEDFFINNTRPDHGAKYCGGNDPTDDVYNGFAIDGFSQVLQAKGAVTPCVEHTLKIIVIDGGDPFADSGVLLEAGSFLAGLVNKPEPNTTAELGTLVPVEGCDTATIRFTRRTLDEPFVNQPLAVKYNLIPFGGNAATATDDPNNPTGADFYLPPSPFVIPAGDTSGVLRIPIFADNDFTEGLEGFVIRYDGTCDCEENADTFFIQDAVPFEVELGPDLSACADDEIVLEAVPLGGNGTYDYLWPDGSTADTVRYVSDGRDTLIRVAVADGCGLTGRDSVFISAPDITASVGGVYSLCSSPTAAVPVRVSGATVYDVVIRIEVAGGTVENVYRVTGDTSLVFDQAATITVISVADAAGCGGAAAGAARVIEAGVEYTADVTPAACNDPVGAISLTLAGGPAEYDIRWLAPTGLTTPTVTDLGPGDYRVVVTPNADPTCPDTLSFTLAATPALSLDAVEAPPLPDCPVGTQITFAPRVSGGAGPYAFDWSNGASTDSLYTITLVAGANQTPLRVTDACGTVLTTTLVYTLDQATATVSGNYSVCNAPFFADVPLAVGGGPGPFTVRIRENDSIRTLTVTGDTILRYTEATVVQLLGVDGADGCPGTAGGIANVTDGEFNVAATVTDVACTGGASGAIDLLVNGNNAPYNFAWSPATLSGPSPADLPAGVYSVTVTDMTPDACTWDTTFTLTEPATALAIADVDVRGQTCEQFGSVGVSAAGGSGALTYAWGDGATTAQRGDLPAGEYRLTVTDGNGCTVADTITVPDDRTQVLAAIAASGSELSCDAPTLQLSAQQNVDPVDYAWTAPSGSELGTDRQITISVPGWYVVRVVNPANGCTATDSVLIGESDDLLMLDLPATYALTCLVDAVNPTVTVVDFGGAVSYAWRSNGNVVSTDPALGSTTTAGTFEVTVTRQDNGCSATATTVVSERRDPPAVVAQDAVRTVSCRDPLTELRVTGDGPFAYRWSTTSGTLVDPAATGPTNTAQGAGDFRAVVIDTTTGCATTVVFSVLNDGATLAVDAGSDQELVCTGAGTVLNAFASPELPGTVYRWRDAAGTLIGAERQVFTQSAGQHVVEVIHPTSGCSSFDSVRVIDNAPTAVDYRLEAAPCPEVGGRLFVNGVTGRNGPFTFSSPTGRPEPLVDGIRGLPAGSNVLVVTDQLGCTLRDTFLVFAGEAFAGTAPDVEIELGDDAVLGVRTNRDPAALTQFTWRNLGDTLACPDCPTPVVTAPLESFVAAVMVMDSNGCVLQLRQNVLVAERELIYMPTAFSPANGDGTNDLYTVFGDGDLVDRVQYLRVFDRWGNQTYAAENFPVNEPTVGWDGRAADGRLFPAGVYVYVLEYVRFDGTSRIVRGSFNLMR